MAAAQLRAPLFEDKVVDFLFAKAEISDRTVTRDVLEHEIEAEGGHVHGPECGHDHGAKKPVAKKVKAEAAPAKKAAAKKDAATAQEAKDEAKPAAKKAAPQNNAAKTKTRRPCAAHLTKT